MNNKIIAAGLMLLLAMGCSPKFKIQTEFPTTGNFKLYKAFKFMSPESMPAANFSFSEENKKILFDAVAEEMFERGYKSQQNAEVIIRVQGGTKISQQELQEYNGPHRNDPYLSGYSWRYDPYNYRRYDDISKKETTIIIDMLDAQTKKLVWQGVGTGVLGKKSDEVEERLMAAVNEIFLEYPFQSAGGAQ